MDPDEDVLECFDILADRISIAGTLLSNISRISMPLT
jgi:hypothetical protein